MAAVALATRNLAPGTNGDCANATVHVQGIGDSLQEPLPPRWNDPKECNCCWYHSWRRSDACEVGAIRALLTALSIAALALELRLNMACAALLLALVLKNDCCRNNDGAGGQGTTRLDLLDRKTKWLSPLE